MGGSSHIYRPENVNNVNRLHLVLFPNMDAQLLRLLSPSAPDDEIIELGDADDPRPFLMRQESLCHPRLRIQQLAARGQRLESDIKTRFMNIPETIIQCMSIRVGGS